MNPCFLIPRQTASIYGCLQTERTCSFWLTSNDKTHIITLLYTLYGLISITSYKTNEVVPSHLHKTAGPCTDHRSSMWPLSIFTTQINPTPNKKHETRPLGLQLFGQDTCGKYNCKDIPHSLGVQTNHNDTSSAPNFGNILS